MLRNEITHNDQCLQLEDPELYNHLSVNYGINRRSILNKVYNFKVTECLPFDTMHVLLEGVIQMEIRCDIRNWYYFASAIEIVCIKCCCFCRLLLQHCIHEEYFTLSYLNKRIMDLDLGYNDSKDRPTQLTKDTVARDNKLGQRGIHIYIIGLCIYL